MADVKSLIDERNKLYEENKALLDKASAEKRTLTKGEDGEEAQFDKREARMAELRATIDRNTSMAAEEAYQAESRGRKTSANVISEGGEVEKDAASNDDFKRGLRAWM